MTLNEICLNCGKLCDLDLGWFSSDLGLGSGSGGQCLNCPNENYATYTDVGSDDARFLLETVTVKDGEPAAIPVDWATQTVAHMLEDLRPGVNVHVSVVGSKRLILAYVTSYARIFECEITAQHFVDLGRKPELPSDRVLRKLIGVKFDLDNHCRCGNCEFCRLATTIEQLAGFAGPRRTINNGGKSESV